MSRQADYRARYAARNPHWKDSSTLFRTLLGSVAGPGSRVLDVGCGRRGLGVALVAGSSFAAGVDPDETALKDNTEIPHRVAAFAERLPFADASFDLVSLRFVVEHLPEPERVFAEASRVLAPGGRIAIVTPNALNPVTWIIRAVPNRFHTPLTRRLFERKDDAYPVRYRANTLRTLDRMLSTAGFAREVVTFNGDPSYLSFGRASFGLSLALERALDTKPLRRARVHLLVVYRKR